MTQRPTFQAQLADGGKRGATSLHGERSLEQRVAELERIVSQTPRVKVGSITISSGTGTQAFTGVGFRPRLVLFFGTAQGASATVGTLMVGAASDSGAYASCVRADAADGNRASSANAYAVLTNNDATIDARGNLHSFDADGFTLNRTVSAGVAIELGYIAIS